MNGLLKGDEPPPQSIPALILQFFTPEIFSRRKTPTKRLGATAWLDGMRGWAALNLAMFHLTVYTHHGIEICYGRKFPTSDQLNTSPAALPILRLPFTGGHFVVMLFFVISGYVVPRRLLQHLHEGRKTDFMEDLQSAMVRRPVRLYLPVIISTFVTLCTWHITGWPAPVWPKKANIFLEIYAWIKETSLFMFFFKYGWLFTSYNVHSWTIAVEMRGSMWIFAYLFVAHNVGTKLRILMTLGMTLHLGVGSPGAWYACFFAGMFLCDLELLATHNPQITMPWDRIDRWFRSNPVVRGVVLHLMLVASLYLATQPTEEFSTRAETLGTCPGWITLSWLIPGAYWDADSTFRWYWLFVGAVIMVYCVREIGWIRRSFESQTAQYLGRHSFALYLVHGELISDWSQYFFYMVGMRQPWAPEHVTRFGWYQDRLINQPWWPLPKGGPFALEPNFLFVVAVSIPMFLYVAELGTKLFDIPGLKASKWAWQKWKTL